MAYSFLDLVNKVDVVPQRYETERFQAYISRVYTLYSHDGTVKLGYVLPIVVNQMMMFSKVVVVNDPAQTIRINPDLDTLEKRNTALNEMGKVWKEDGVFKTLDGWRDELYTIYGSDKRPYMRLERALCPLLGVVMYGVHINGYVEDDETGEIKIWVPRRAADKPTYPGMLDNTVAGGIGYPYGTFDTCVKECYEEAGLNEDFVKKNLKSVGLISYLYQFEDGQFDSENGLVQPEVEYVYDLKMGKDIIPHPVDHESEDFKLMGVDEVITRMKNGEFKHNCAAIIIDFLIRHSIITPENEPDFILINAKLHRLLPFPLRPNA